MFIEKLPEHQIGKQKLYINIVLFIFSSHNQIFIPSDFCCCSKQTKLIIELIDISKTK